MAGVLLAAGAGRRFGGPKALVDFCGRSLGERGVALLRSSGTAPIVVVLGAEAPRVRARSDLRPAVVVDNSRWTSGIGSSLRAALRALEEWRVGACVIALADQPLVAPAAVRRLVAAWQQGAAVAAAAYGGAVRNPVLLDRRLWRDVAASATGDVGARRWLRLHGDAVAPVECSDVAHPGDIDTPRDLTVLRRVAQQRDWARLLGQCST